MALSNNLIRSESHFHFIGIGGIGMSGLALVLLSNGNKITGSDMKMSKMTERLKNMGVIIYEGHEAKNVGNADIVVYSSAVKPENCEFQKALQLSIPLINRSQLLGDMTKHSKSIAITGTHGKTTTSSILSKIFFDASLDPTILLGGVAPFIKSNAYSGKGEHTIFEACEAYGSLYSYYPMFAVLTNLDLDHLDYFKSLGHLKKEMLDFMNRIPFYGQLFINGDDKNLRELIRSYNKEVITFGIEEKDVNWKAKDIKYNTSLTTFDVLRDETFFAKVNSPLLGTHNVYNVLSAISVASELGIDKVSITRSINSFVNSDRRLQLIGIKDGVSVYNDYAHHPVEISATLKGLKQSGVKKIISVFQPHLYSRTKTFYKEFAKSLSLSEYVFLLPIYPARETNIPGISSQLIKDSLEQDYSYLNAINFLSKEKLLKEISSFASSGFAIITFGAGDIDEVAPQILQSI